MTPRFFDTAAALRAWMARNHAKEPALWIGFYKTPSGRGGITYRQALDEALCHGWIDGVRKTLDRERWTIRFTPRRPKSRWSRVNLARVDELLRAGRMAAPGKKAYAARDSAPKRGYSYESRPQRLAPAREKAFRANRRAWAFFEAQPPSYRRTSCFWIESAVQEATRARRLAQLIASSARGQRLGPIEGKKK